MSNLFTTQSFSLSLLVNMIDGGSIGLPEIQRPFVWPRTKVRDLFDSMYRGFPVGYFLFWKNTSPGARQIGVKEHQSAPERMIVDGQQRLTSLYAIIKGTPVIGSDYKSSTIEIAFNPRKEEFQVSSAAIVKDREWIPNISALWEQETNLFTFVGHFVGRLREGQDIDVDEERKIGERINRLFSLQNYNFTAIELSPDSDPEEVADIFVRINSAGVELNQADFILTLMSVYWDEGRKELERFCREAKQSGIVGPSPFNYFLDPAPDQLLRVAIGLGFRKGRLRSVYTLLRGRDVQTEKYSDEARARNFETLRSAQAQVLNLTNWHEFMKCLMRAGFRSNRMITSENAILYTYVLYLVGRCEYKITSSRLRELIGKWFFMSTITSRYTGSYETQIESDLSRVSSANDKDEFCNLLDRIVAETLTTDFWSITLPNALETTATRSPYLFGYYAALNSLGARVLFSTLTVAELFDPVVRGDRAALERHHLFPKAYLKSIKIEEPRLVNQIANYALVEWPDNVAISDDAPAEYSRRLMSNFAQAERDRMLEWHALPESWANMDFRAFLDQRRKLIAEVTRRGFEAISTKAMIDDEPRLRVQPDLKELIDAGENYWVEFKSTARWNMRSSAIDAKLEHSVLKTIAGFLNAGGGTLVIGIDDIGKVIGIGFDYRTLQKKNRDGFELWLGDLVDRALGKAALAALRMSFAKLEGEDIAIIAVAPSRQIIFLNPAKGPRVDEVYVRFGNSTRRLTPSELLQYQDTRALQDVLSDSHHVPESVEL